MTAPVIARQHHLQLAPAEDQHPIQHLTTNRAYPPFCERVRPRCLHRCAQDLEAFGAEDRIEAVGEPRVAIADEESELPHAVQGL